MHAFIRQCSECSTERTLDWFSPYNEPNLFGITERLKLGLSKPAADFYPSQSYDRAPTNCFIFPPAKYSSVINLYTDPLAKPRLKPMQCQNPAFLPFQSTELNSTGPRLAVLSEWVSNAMIPTSNIHPISHVNSALWPRRHIDV